jgi:hypothetical protein
LTALDAKDLGLTSGPLCGIMLAATEMVRRDRVQNKNVWQSRLMDVKLVDGAVVSVASHHHTP